MLFRARGKLTQMPGTAVDARPRLHSCRGPAVSSWTLGPACARRRSDVFSTSFRRIPAVFHPTIFMISSTAVLARQRQSAGGLDKTRTKKGKTYPNINLLFLCGPSFFSDMVSQTPVVAVAWHIKVGVGPTPSGDFVEIQHPQTQNTPANKNLERARTGVSLTGIDKAT